MVHLVSISTHLEQHFLTADIFSMLDNTTFCMLLQHHPISQKLQMLHSVRNSLALVITYSIELRCLLLVKQLLQLLQCIAFHNHKLLVSFHANQQQHGSSNVLSLYQGHLGFRLQKDVP